MLSPSVKTSPFYESIIVSISPNEKSLTSEFILIYVGFLNWNVFRLPKVPHIYNLPDIKQPECELEA